MKKTHNTKKGFSIGEVMISAFILIVGVVGGLVLIINNLTISHDSRDTIIAAQLAQEGIEIVRNIRDNDVAERQEEIGNEDFNPLDAVQSLSLHLNYDFSSGTDVQLRHDGTFYTHNASDGATTGFERKIDTLYNSGPTSEITDDSIKILSFVTWSGESVSDYNAGNFRQCTVANKCSVATTTLTTWIGHD